MWKANTSMHITHDNEWGMGESGKEIRLTSTHASGLSETTSAKGQKQIQSQIQFIWIAIHSIDCNAIKSFDCILNIDIL